MATFLAVPVKRTWEVDLVSPLRAFISMTFANASPEEFMPGLTEIHRLRNNMINKSVDKHESALDVLYRYHDQLVSLEAKVPMTENGVRISFKWQDAFDKPSFMSGKRTLSIASGAYERVCVLFNIGALQSQVADSQNHSSDDGLKTSVKLFQQSSGIFSQLNECVLACVQNDPTPDLHPDTLAALSALMLAQAQDCIVHKAMQDKMKPAVTAKLAHQCSDLYAEAMKLLQLDSIRGLWPKDWIPNVASKQASYHALAEYYQSLVHKEKKEFGEEIARLRHAKELITAAEQRGGSHFLFQDQSKKIIKALTDANKDNDFIYHARIPDISSLPAIEKTVVAKILKPNVPMSANFKDALEKVVPLSVHTALQGFENRKQEIVNREIARSREATQLLNSVLASLNLPAAIEDSGSKVPQSLLEKAGKVREMGGISHLNRLMSDLPELLTRNREILDESDRMLAEEEASDRQLREQFKERWTRTPSPQLTEVIKAEGNKYRKILDNAIQADHIVQSRYEQCRNGVELMSKSQGELQAALPAGNQSSALKGNPAVAELKKYMSEVEAIKNEREVMENELKNAKCDMANIFLAALAKDGAINEEQLSEEQLDRVYRDLRKQVSDSLQKQEQLLAHIQDANTRFGEAKAQNQSGASREQVLKDLAAAYDGFVELKNNLEEGTKFYNDLTQLLVKYQSKVSDFCFARRTEKEELMKDLQSAIARQPAQAPPAAPSYQATMMSTSGAQANMANGGAGKGGKKPPPRPPQPAPRSHPNQAGAANTPPVAPPVAPPGSYPGYHSSPQQGPYVRQQGNPPYPAPGYNNIPYPVAPPAGYYSPPVPQGYNPYASYGYPQQTPPGQYPQQQAYPAYPGYPQQ
ncbi:hypothetical protein LSH36_141g09036 [Paralvinella palmiformis]|uniref:BRO1 domain-containing protein n=1 Tax=Paralvinella palmiformis TaxID=53620 RepID=A0AAD9JXM9_9ANNE|nr:hypothetical protein LSH36_141g09036 [Paralvinella palmiformis]